MTGYHDCYERARRCLSHRFVYWLSHHRPCPEALSLSLSCCFRRTATWCWRSTPALASSMNPKKNFQGIILLILCSLHTKLKGNNSPYWTGTWFSRRSNTQASGLKLLACVSYMCHESCCLPFQIPNFVSFCHDTVFPTCHSTPKTATSPATNQLSEPISRVASRDISYRCTKTRDGIRANGVHSVPARCRSNSASACKTWKLGQESGCSTGSLATQLQGVSFDSFFSTCNMRRLPWKRGRNSRSIMSHQG